MQGFALKVCGMPEVRCVTYSELLDYMNKLPESDRLAFQKSEFQQMPGVEAAKQSSLTNLRMEHTADGVSAFNPKESDGPSLIPDPPGAHESHPELTP